MIKLLLVLLFLGVPPSLSESRQFILFSVSATLLGGSRVCICIVESNVIT